MATSSVAVHNIENLQESVMTHAIDKALVKHAVPQNLVELIWIAEKVFVNINLINSIRLSGES